MAGKETFGINMRDFCRRHEAEVGRALEGRVTRQALDTHFEKLRWLQHERLIHLIVVVLTALAELFCVDLTVLHPETNPLAALCMLALAVLLGFYFVHYFFLENTTQRWYALAEKLYARLDETE